MQVKIPITSKVIRNHFVYWWWQYAVLIVVAVFGWNLLFTTTQYRSPPPLVVEWYYEGFVGKDDTANIDAFLADTKEKCFPTMEVVDFISFIFDETYGPMQLTVWAAAGQGDLYHVGKEGIHQFINGGALLDLQPYVDSGALDVSGMDISEGYVTNAETGEKMLGMIPADTLTGLEAFGLNAEGYYFGLLATGGNIDNTISLLNEIIQHCKPIE